MHRGSPAAYGSFGLLREICALIVMIPRGGRLAVIYKRARARRAEARHAPHQECHVKWTNEPVSRDWYRLRKETRTLCSTRKGMSTVELPKVTQLYSCVRTPLSYDTRAAILHTCTHLYRHIEQIQQQGSDLACIHTKSLCNAVIG